MPSNRHRGLLCCAAVFVSIAALLIVIASVSHSTNPQIENKYSHENQIVFLLGVAALLVAVALCIVSCRDWHDATAEHVYVSQRSTFDPLLPTPKDSDAKFNYGTTHDVVPVATAVASPTTPLSPLHEAVT